MVASTRDKFLDVEAKVIKHLIDSLICNMPKCATDLRDNIPEEIDMAKLQFWHLHWTKEKERSKREKFIDTQFVFSKKIRIKQVK